MSTCPWQMTDGALARASNGVGFDHEERAVQLDIVHGRSGVRIPKQRSVENYFSQAAVPTSQRANMGRCGRPRRGLGAPHAPKDVGTPAPGVADIHPTGHAVLDRAGNFSRGGPAELAVHPGSTGEGRIEPPLVACLELRRACSIPVRSGSMGGVHGHPRGRALDGLARGLPFSSVADGIARWRTGLEATGEAPNKPTCANM
jgi:hypothetical protein